MIIFLTMYTHPKTLQTVQYLEERGPIPVLLSNIQPSKDPAQWKNWEDREPIPHCQFCCPAHSHPKTQLTTGRTENLYHIASSAKAIWRPSSLYSAWRTENLSYIASFAVQHTPMHQSSQRPSALYTVQCLEDGTPLPDNNSLAHPPSIRTTSSSYSA